MLRPFQPQCHIASAGPFLGRAELPSSAHMGQTGLEMDGAGAARFGSEFLERVMGGWFAFLVVPG